MNPATLQPSRQSAEHAASNDVNPDHSFPRMSSPRARWSTPGTTLLLLVTLVPYLAIPCAHVMSSPATATGFFHYELPYYVANGRAAFERGNGILYPNPYDPAPDAPAIYAHWLPWILGLLTAGAGFDPGDVVLTLTFFGSLAFAASTWKLVRTRTSGPLNQHAAYAAGMLGGGLLCLSGALLGSPQSLWADRLLQIDPGHGFWFLNWGRNALFPTEAVYHAVVAMCWLSEIRNRPQQANVWMLLLATTHPWSGLELLLTVGLWRTVCYISERSVSSRNQLLIVAAVLSCFLVYYKVWLPLFSAHARLQRVWELAWNLPWSTALAAYAPVAVPAAVLVFRRIRNGPFLRSERFLLCALAVAISLAFHDRIIKPVQPLHFTRGYLWMPMFLIGLPVATRWCRTLYATGRFRRLACAAVAALLLTDNLIFCALQAARQLDAEDGFHISADDRAVFRDLARNARSSVVLTESMSVNYLLPAYTPVRPWIGHQFNTPLFAERRAVMKRVFTADTVKATAIPPDVDVVLFCRDRSAAALRNSGQWRSLNLQNVFWQGWQRTTTFHGDQRRH